LANFVTMYPEIQLKKGKEFSIERQHPWIFSGAISTDCSALTDGELVTVTDAKKAFLAVGHYQHASIAVRVLSFEPCVIDSEFWLKKIENAVQLRRKLGLFTDNNEICRLCHGEGDNLPGLVIDYYGKVAVIQCHSIGMTQHLEAISLALQQVLTSDLIAVYNKSSETLPKRKDEQDGYVFGDCTVPHYAKENGITYAIDWVNGQKTGFFIDQRENRRLLGLLSQGKKVLNTFCYSGGFSLQALVQGATVVSSLDSSKKAIALTEENIALNQFEGEHHAILADAMDYMKELPIDYDIIVLDPPAFAKHRDKKHQAIQGYKRLNAHAIRQIKSGGMLMTFSCSQVIDKVLFTNTVISAAIEAKRNVRILHQLHQPADHPINAFHPEGEYLKGLILYVE